jgi:hypothetical protein
MRVTIRTSPACKNSSTVRSASRPSVVVPLRFSARMANAYWRIMGAKYRKTVSIDAWR